MNVGGLTLGEALMIAVSIPLLATVMLSALDGFHIWPGDKP